MGIAGELIVQVIGDLDYLVLPQLVLFFAPKVDFQGVEPEMKDTRNRRKLSRLPSLGRPQQSFLRLFHHLNLGGKVCIVAEAIVVVEKVGDHFPLRGKEPRVPNVDGLRRAVREPTDAHKALVLAVIDMKINQEVLRPQAGVVLEYGTVIPWLQSYVQGEGMIATGENRHVVPPGVEVEQLNQPRVVSLAYSACHMDDRVWQGIAKHIAHIGLKVRRISWAGKGRDGFPSARNLKLTANNSNS